MANTVKVKRGTFATLPTLEAGEFAITTDTFQAYFGDGANNHELAVLGAARALNVGAITGTSFIIGANTLNTDEWAILDGITANKTIDHTSVTLTAGVGLSGGGDISANRTFTFDATELEGVTWGGGAQATIVHTFNVSGTDTTMTYGNGEIRSSCPFSATTGFRIGGGATAGKILVGNGTDFVESTPTFPNASATTGKFIISDGTNWVASTPTISTTTTAGKILIGDGTNWVSSTPKYPNASATAGKVIRSDGTDYAASTFTIPDTMAINAILYASAANVISALATGNSGVLVTGAGGIPSISTTLPNGLTFGTLAANWDIGDNIHLITDTVMARDAAGLELFEDGGTGIFVKDGGNFGFGITDIESWAAGRTVIQIGGVGAISATTAVGAPNGLELIDNGYISDAWRYTVAGKATLYYQYDGYHYFRSAISGVKDAAITWITGLTVCPLGGVNVGGDSEPGFGNLRVGGYTISPAIYGGTANNGDITIEATTSGTKTTSFVFLQPNGGNVVIGSLASLYSEYYQLQIVNPGPTIIMAQNTTASNYSEFRFLNNNGDGLLARAYGTTNAGNHAGVARANGIAFMAGATLSSLYIGSTSTTSIPIYFGTTDTSWMKMAAGLVGIGTTAASAKFALNGGANFGGDSDPGDDCILVAGSIFIRDSAIYIKSQADTFMDIVADGAVRIGDGVPTNYANFSPIGNLSFVGTSGFYPRRIRQNAIPAAGTGATEIDTGELVMWCHADGADVVSLVYNDATKGVVSIALA
jgi:hypothetical protein